MPTLLEALSKIFQHKENRNMKKFIVTLMLLFGFTVFYQMYPGDSTMVRKATGNWIQFSENGIFLSDSQPATTIKVPVTQDSTVVRQGQSPEYDNHSILVPGNFKLFVPYHSLKAVKRN
jgi:hypothetical protein